MDGSIPQEALYGPHLKPRLRVCVQNDDGKGEQHALAMPALRDPNGSSEYNRLTVQDGWVDAHLEVVNGLVWLMVTDLELGLRVGGWRVQTFEFCRTYVDVFDEERRDWRDATEKDFRDWEGLANATKA